MTSTDAPYVAGSTPPDVEHALGVASDVVDDLTHAGLEPALSVQLAKQIIAHAQHVNLAHGGTGSGDQVAALLLAAVRLLTGIAKDGRIACSHEELFAVVERVCAPPTVDA
jgi:hypothetical protein